MKIKVNSGFGNSGDATFTKNAEQEIEVADDYFRRLTATLYAPQNATLFVGRDMFDAIKSELKKRRH